MSKLGTFIRENREAQGLLLREVAGKLEMDTPMLSKIERGVRQIKRDRLKMLSEVLHEEEKTLTTLWLADKIYDVVKDEDLGADALNVAEQELEYTLLPKRENR